MSTNQAKWKTNQEKVAFIKQFPGLINSWEEIHGQTVQSVTPLNIDPRSAVIVFNNGTFAIVPPINPEPKQIGVGISAIRTDLEKLYPDALAQYDILNQKDREAKRVARLENILGAIKNNLDEIPELKEQIRSLVKKWQS